MSHAETCRGKEDFIKEKTQKNPMFGKRIFAQDSQESLSDPGLDKWSSSAGVQHHWSEEKFFGKMLHQVIHQFGFKASRGVKIFDQEPEQVIYINFEEGQVIKKGCVMIARDKFLPGLEQGQVYSKIVKFMSIVKGKAIRFLLERLSGFSWKFPPLCIL